MNEDTIKEIKNLHIINYKNSIIESIKNNSNVLVDNDIKSLLKKPPLDSMDLIKSKFLDVAKKCDTILNIDKLSKMLDKYRVDIIKCCDDIKKTRIDTLISKVDNYVLLKENDVIKINKKDFNDINKKIKKILKESLSKSLEKNIENNIKNIFKDMVDDSILSKFKTDVLKYIKGSYQKQLIENFDIKVLVKDTTLINVVREQSDRYLFTLRNSRILNDIIE